MPYITWRTAAEAIINSEFLGQEASSVDQYIKDATNEKIAVFLLYDIAKSLRILRCSNFKDIPDILRKIRGNTRKRKRKP